jgi:inner membrane protein
VDPLTHALAGAAVAYGVAGQKAGRGVLLLGATAALLPDVDYLIRSAADPLLAIEHHRGFTHSLVMIPVGGAIAALPPLLAGDRRKLLWYLAAAMAAWATHPLLDAATTYGTQLFWPFSRYRVGLDWISIIDPLFTLILLSGVIAGLIRMRQATVVFLLVASLWLGLGAMQRERAVGAQRQLTALRGEARERGAVFPTVGNNVVWRSIYLSEGQLMIDRLRVPWFGEASYATGTIVPLELESELSPELRRSERIVRDFRRFRWFSDGWIARAPADPTVIGDARYSLRADLFDPIWGVRFDPDSDPPTEWVNRTRDRDVAPSELWREITGRNLEYAPLR